MIPTIYLASDSTVQSYAPENAPQTGWGQVLIYQFAKNPEEIRAFHPDNTAFEHVMRYEAPGIAVDNRAYAGRSARSFMDEGRLSDLEACLVPGDYLFVQFAHNDANKGKPERYIPVEEYPSYLDRYRQAAVSKGAIQIFVTAICMRTFIPDGTLPCSFPEYRNAMLDWCAKKQQICLDLGLATRDFCEALGPEETKKIFMWTLKGEYPGGPYCEGSEDNAHLKYEGACAFAGLLADEIRKCEKLSALARLLRSPDRD